MYDRTNNKVNQGGCYLPIPAEPRGITPSILRPHPIITNNDDTNN